MNENNRKNQCAYCGASLGGGHFRIYSNKAGLWFERESCRKKWNAEERNR